MLRKIFRAELAKPTVQLKPWERCNYQEKIGGNGLDFSIMYYVYSSADREMREKG
jgi:hypothetical protein